MAKAKAKIPCYHWHLTYQDGTSNKFYTVYVSESGVCVLRWGRIGSIGQNSVTSYGNYQDARDVALRQVYSKKSKGYVQQGEEVKFMTTQEVIDWALGANIDPLLTAHSQAVSNGDFGGSKDAVLTHYAAFAEQAKNLMDRAAYADLAEVMDQYESLEKVWEEINAKHAEVTTAMSFAKQTMTQKLMGAI